MSAPSDWPRVTRNVVKATKVAAERYPYWGTAGNAMVIAMLTSKPPALGAVALLLLLPDIALAQARSSVGAAPSPRVSVPSATLRTAPSVSSGGTTPAAPSTSLSTTPSAGPIPPGAGVAATTSPTAPTTGSTVAPLSPMSEPLPVNPETGGGSSGGSSLALSPGSTSSGSNSPSQSAPSKPGGGGKSLADCMGFWDAATHMTKVEWRAACKRSMKEYPDIKW